MKEETFSIIAIFIVVFFIAYVVLSLIYIGIALGAVDESGQLTTTKPELKCMYYSDGKLAVIRSFPCDGYEKTISWFLSKGYHIAGTSNPSDYNANEVYMTR